MASQKRPPKVTAKLDTAHGHHWQEHVKKRLDEFAELVAHFMFERGIDTDYGEFELVLGTGKESNSDHNNTVRIGPFQKNGIRVDVQLDHKDTCRQGRLVCPDQEKSGVLDRFYNILNEPIPKDEFAVIQSISEQTGIDLLPFFREHYSGFGSVRVSGWIDQILGEKWATVETEEKMLLALEDIRKGDFVEHGDLKVAIRQVDTNSPYAFNQLETMAIIKLVTVWEFLRKNGKGFELTEKAKEMIRLFSHVNAMRTPAEVERFLDELLSSESRIQGLASKRSELAQEQRQLFAEKQAIADRTKEIEKRQAEIAEELAELERQSQCPILATAQNELIRLRQKLVVA